MNSEALTWWVLTSGSRYAVVPRINVFRQMNTSRGVPPLVKENNREWNEIYVMVVKWNIYGVYKVKTLNVFIKRNVFMTLNTIYDHRF